MIINHFERIRTLTKLKESLTAGFLMGIVTLLGRLSDRLTIRMLSPNSTPATSELIRDRQGFVRKAQLAAVLAISRPMMLANLANAFALILLEFYEGQLSLTTLFWAFVVTAFVISGWRNTSRFRKSTIKNTASIRAPGKIALSSVILAGIWCYPLIVIMPIGGSIQIAFVSTVTAGMVAGGALALYPVPLAGLLYTSILSIVAFVTLAFGGHLPPLPFGLVITAFGFVVIFSMFRHTGMFLSELVGKLEAQRQRDVMNLLLDSFQGQGGQYLWRCNSKMDIMTEPEPLWQMLGLRVSASQSINLGKILDRVGAEVRDPMSQEAYSAFKRNGCEANTNFEIALNIYGGRVLRVAGRQEINESQAPAACHGYIKDVTTEVRALEEAYQLATRDSMTGLLNYGEFRKRAAVMLDAVDGDTSLVRFLFVDADNLKMVNDNFGHAVGDQLIEHIGSRLAQILPEGSLIARKGGDEFVALLQVRSNTDAATWSEKLLSGLTRDFNIRDAKIPVSCCIGVANATGREASLQKLELEADRALYYAKSQGKRQSRVYDNTIGAEIHRDRTLARDFETALGNGELRLDFQPIVDLSTEKISGAEALLRWHHSTFAAVAPEKIVAIAQSEGLGLALFEYVLKAATKSARDWPFDGFVSVNMEPADLQWSGFAQHVVEILDITRFPADRLWLEVTESELLRNSREVQSNLAALRSFGVSIAVDDFGAGYSSLSYLRTHVSDIIKIDRSVIRDCDTNASSKITIDAMKALAKVNGLKVVAEGAETLSEVRALKNADFEMVQGFALHRPMDSKHLNRLLRSQVSNPFPDDLQKRCIV